MNYATVCSGIEAPTVAWHGLGFEPVWFSEIEPFPCKLLKHHYPQVPNLGDMTKLNQHETYRNTTIDLLCGGTPCQSFSIAGLRGGLDDERGNLALEYCRILIAKRPRWFVWENVPGVFSSNGGKDFACILSAFTGTEVNAAGLGNAGIIQGELYSVAWRVLDAQYFGVPQRRRRVFVVGYTGNNWRAPYAVLFEPESLRRDFTPRREKGQNTTGTVEGDNTAAGFYRMNGFGDNLQSHSSGALKKRDHKDATDLVTQSYGLDEDKNSSVQVYGLDSELNGTLQNSGCLTAKKTGGYFHAVAFGSPNSHTQSMAVDNITPTLDKSKTPAVVYDALADDTADTLAKCANQTPGFIGEEVATVSPTLTKHNLDSRSPQSEEQQRIIGAIVNYTTVARRLTPLECERLQGFHDNYTNIPGSTGWRKAQPYETEQYCIENNLKYKVNKAGKIRVQDADGPRCAAIGNSMAVPVMRWIGERIMLMDKVLNNLKTKAA